MYSSQVNEDEYALFYRNYILKVPDAVSLVDLIEQNETKIHSFFLNIPEDRLEYQYLPDKWTIKEIFLHIIDTERIMAYRALRIARGDLTQLPGFEQDLYVANCGANKRSIRSLQEEYQAVRKSTLGLFKNFSKEDLIQKAVASNEIVSVRALGFIICGHEIHHMDIIKERYLN